MSPQAIANPDDLERFAKELKRFNSLMQEGTSRIRGQFMHLGETWRDQEHHKFADQFEQTMRVIDQFVRTSDEHIPFLMKKAQRLREYLDQR